MPQISHDGPETNGNASAPSAKGPVCPGGTPAMDLFRSLEAIGMAKWEVVANVAHALGEDGVKDLFIGWRWLHGAKEDEISWRCYKIAKVAPEWVSALVMCEWLGACPTRLGSIDLRDLPHISALPLKPGTEILGRLVLKGVGVTALPESLRVHELNLDGSGIRTLPSGLEVADISIIGCRDWDGRFPDDMEAFSVRTDAHQESISLKEWRRLHPNGERP